MTRQQEVSVTCGVLEFLVPRSNSSSKSERLKVRLLEAGHKHEKYVLASAAVGCQYKHGGYAEAAFGSALLVRRVEWWDMLSTSEMEAVGVVSIPADTSC